MRVRYMLDIVREACTVWCAFPMGRSLCEENGDSCLVADCGVRRSPFELAGGHNPMRKWLRI